MNIVLSPDPKMFGQTYLLDDDFLDTLAAGAIHGTKSTSLRNAVPATRTAVDIAGDKMSIANSALTFAGGSGTTGDPGLWDSAPIITRAAGICIVFRDLTITDVTAIIEFGLDTGVSGAISENALRISADTLLMVNSGTAQAVLATPADGVKYDLLFNLRAAGCFYYWRLAGAAVWTLLGMTATGATASLYMAAANNSASGTVGRWLRGLVAWHGTPLISEGFSGSNGALGGVLTDGLGHLETTGLGSGGAGIAWHGYAWTVATNKAVGTPVLGAELVTNGNMETGDPPTGWTAATATLDGVADERTGGDGAQSLSVARNGANYSHATHTFTAAIGRWIYTTLWGKVVTGGSFEAVIKSGAAVTDGSIGANSSTSWVQVRNTCRISGANPYIRLTNYSSGADGTECRFDDISVKPMPISSLMAVAAVPSNLGTDCDIRADVVCTAGTQAGVCIADVSFHARMTAAYAAGVTAITLDEVTQAITTNDTITVRGAADTTYTIASVGTLAAGVQSIVLGSGLVADIADDVEVGCDYAVWNGVMWYTDTVNCHMDVITAGVAAANINTAATYASGNTLALWRNGTAFRGYQKDVFIGTQQTVAGITGTYVCMFSTYASNTIDNVVVRRVLETVPGVD